MQRSIKWDFLETPYRKVVDGKVDVTGDIMYLSAEAEDYRRIAQANAQVAESGAFVKDKN
jgi:DNA-directed RNA polymerase subunit beta